MPTSTRTSRTPRTHTRNHNKRLGKHHKRNHRYAKVYAPYLPLVISIIASLFISILPGKSSGNTLAYATDVSVGGLLASTNQHRANNGVAALSNNAKLNASAQAKANDMVAQNYWSHTSPNGDQPWVFFDAAGYHYVKAGENLAYGFATSSDAVLGWMNSPTHKANMLDGAFTEVGFGFANSPNFNGDGQQTVIVAHYGKPQVMAQQAPPTVPSTTGSTPAPTQTTPEVQPPPPPTPEPVPPKDPEPVTSELPVAEAAPVSQDVARAQTVVNGQAPWLLTATTISLGLLVLIKVLHFSIILRRFLRHHKTLRNILYSGERLIFHHPLIDSTIFGLAILGYVLSRTIGTIL
jgi:uncharacterized protein YkwD